MTNKFEEVDYVIKTLKTAKLTQEKKLIILSSVMTWVNTPPKLEKPGEEEEPVEEGAEAEAEEEEEEEPDSDAKPEEEQLDEEGNELPKPPKVLFFKETDNHLRVPHEAFLPHKNLETLALSAPKAQPNLKVHILCCGIRYGLGEGVFYEHYKHAWIQKPAALPIVGKGDNFVPTIHNADLARLVQRITKDNTVVKPYIFAVDKTKKPTQKRITTAISKGVGTGQVRFFEPGQISSSIVWKDFVSINLKMKTSDVFADRELPEEVEDEDGSKANALKFRWHCKDGIIKNAQTLNTEFNQVRKLNPVKIFITGPPASGKTFYSEKVLSYYNLPRIHVKALADSAFAMGNVDEEEAEGLAAEIKAKIEELKDAEVEKINEANEKLRELNPDMEEAPEVDRDGLKVRIPDDILYKLLKIRLNENDCRNRGYILDGFPRNHDDCQNIFLKPIQKFDEEGQPIDYEEPELGEGEEKSWDEFIIDDTIAPTSCIVLKQQEQFLIDRVKNLPEAVVAGTHYNVADTKRRFRAYQKANLSDVADPSVQDFFRSNQVQIFAKDCALDSEAVMNSMKIYIERVSKLPLKTYLKTVY